MSTKKVRRGAASNLPAFAYVERIGTAVTNALLAQAETYNDSWDKAKEGKFGFSDLMKTWAVTLDSYYDVLLEASRGPAYQTKPPVIFFNCIVGPGKKTTMPTTFDVMVDLDCPEPVSVEATPTPLSNLDDPTGSLDEKVYKKCDFLDDKSRKQLHIVLDADRLKKAKGGKYIGFVVAKAESGTPPLAIVALQVTTK